MADESVTTALISWNTNRLTFNRLT